MPRTRRGRHCGVSAPAHTADRCFLDCYGAGRHVRDVSAEAPCAKFHKLLTRHALACRCGCLASAHLTWARGLSASDPSAPEVAGCGYAVAAPAPCSALGKARPGAPCPGGRLPSCSRHPGAGSSCLSRGGRLDRTWHRQAAGRQEGGCLPRRREGYPARAHYELQISRSAGFRSWLTGQALLSVIRLPSASGGTGTKLADIRLLDACEALRQYSQWESDSSGHGWPEELGTLASSLGLLVELAEGSESSAGAGACLSAVSS
jgi:hypothetical protein